jgi:hypothetical protein
MTDRNIPDDDWDEADSEEPIIDGEPAQTIEGMVRDSEAGQDFKATLRGIGGRATTSISQPRWTPHGSRRIRALPAWIGVGGRSRRYLLCSR